MEVWRHITGIGCIILLVKLPILFNIENTILSFLEIYLHLRIEPSMVS